MLFKNSKLALSGIIALAVSVILIFFSKTIVNSLAFGILVNGNFASVEGLNMFTVYMSCLGYFLMFLGAGLFIFIGWTSRFQVDRQQVKHDMRKVKVAFALTACVLMVVSMVMVQSANANSMATTGYYLATPYSPYDWLVGRFSTGLIYAINGSSWANMMTWPTPAAWSSLAGNNTGVVDATLTATSAGTIYLKEVAFDYALTIPANVQVIENVNGLTRTFVASSESTGSPYTISIDTVNTTYYMCQDSAGRFLDTWTSLNASSVFWNSLANNTKIIIASGTFTAAAGSDLIGTDSPMYFENTTIWGSGKGITILKGGQDVVNFANCKNIELAYFSVDTTSDSYAWAQEAIDMDDCDNSYIHDVEIRNARDGGIKFDSGDGVQYGNRGRIINCDILKTYGCNIGVWGDNGTVQISHNRLSHSGQNATATQTYAIHLSAVGNGIITDNIISGCVGGIYVKTLSSNNTITNNNIKSITQNGIYLADTASNNMVTGNHLELCYDAVRVNAGCLSNTIMPNTFVGNTHLKIYNLEPTSIMTNYNFLSGVVGAASGWTSNPTNLNLITDGDVYTSCGQGTKTNNVAWSSNIGTLIFALNPTVNTTASLTLSGLTVSTNVTCNIYCYIGYSFDDGSTYPQETQYNFNLISSTDTPTTLADFSIPIHGNYVRLRFRNGATPCDFTLGGIAELKAVYEAT